MRYDFEIVYKIGSSNNVVHAFSRRLEGEEEEANLRVMTKLLWQEFDSMEEEVQNDGELKKIIQDLK